jgi:hypothetical protein
MSKEKVQQWLSLDTNVEYMGEANIDVLEGGFLDGILFNIPVN